MSDSVRPHRRQPTKLRRPWDSPGKNTGVGCHFLLQCRKVKVKSLSRVRLLATPWTAAYQAPPSMGFSRQEYWSGVPLPSLKSSGENRKKNAHFRICQKIINNMDTKQGLPYFNKLLEYLVYVKEATVSFKMQPLRDCSTTGQSAFKARVLSVF